MKRLLKFLSHPALSAVIALVAIIAPPFVEHHKDALLNGPTLIGRGIVWVFTAGKVPIIPVLIVVVLLFLLLVRVVRKGVTDLNRQNLFNDIPDGITVGTEWMDVESVLPSLDTAKYLKHKEFYSPPESEIGHRWEIPLDGYRFHSLSGEIHFEQDEFVLDLLLSTMYMPKEGISIILSKPLKRDRIDVRILLRDKHLYTHPIELEHEERSTLLNVFLIKRGSSTFDLMISLSHGHVRINGLPEDWFQQFALMTPNTRKDLWKLDGVVICGGR